MRTWVVPYIGTWIETLVRLLILTVLFRRTLYRYVDWNSWTAETSTSIKSRTLYRYVDWNLLLRKNKLPLPCRTLYRYVDWNTVMLPYLSSSRSRTLYRYVDWNLLSTTNKIIMACRTLYRYVDWNRNTMRRPVGVTVVPYIGTWIETDQARACAFSSLSYLI